MSITPNQYRVFSANWWQDKACTRPIEGPRRKKTIALVPTLAEAQALCAEYNLDSIGRRIERPFGLAYEYEAL